MLTLEALCLQQDDFCLTADLTVATGAQVAVIGPSGAGKSTLLSAIAGFLTPTSGRLLWNGTNITGLDPGTRPLSIVFQDNNLFPHMTVFQNVALGLRPNLRLSDTESAKITDSLIKVGLTALFDRKPSALSGGQQSRVAIARTLVRARPLILLDEPFAALGPALRVEMLDLVKSLASQTGATLLMVTHDPKEALRLGGQTILVADGRAEPPQNTDALLADPPASLRAYLE